MSISEWSLEGKIFAVKYYLSTISGPGRCGLNNKANVDLVLKYSQMLTPTRSGN